jgi:VWFA-related protein
MNAAYRYGRILIHISGFLLTAAAQQPANPTAQATPGEVRTPAVAASGDDLRQVVLDVVVTDKSGKPIPGLQQQDFIVLDNKQPAKILSFHAQSGAAVTSGPEAGVELFLVFDEVNTPLERVWFERDAVKRFLAQNNGKLPCPVSLAFFSEAGIQIQNQSSQDGFALADALEQHQASMRTIGRSEGFFGNEDRVRLSLDALNSLAAREKASPGRKMVIWISPGWPLLSGARDTLTPAQKQHVFNSVVRLSAALREARITLYSIDPLGASGAGGIRTSFYEEFVKGLPNPDRAQVGDLGLQTVATQTGGRAIFGNDAILNSINHCAADLGAYYVLSIESPPADRANEYHGIEVKLGTKGLTARTRTGYYAQSKGGQTE